MIVVEIDKELAVCAVWICRARCRQCPSIMWDARKFCLKVWKLGPTSTRHTDIKILFHIAVFHITCLGHKAINHTVKSNVVIGTTAGQFLDALTVLNVVFF